MLSWHKFDIYSFTCNIYYIIRYLCQRFWSPLFLSWNHNIWQYHEPSYVQKAYPLLPSWFVIFGLGEYLHHDISCCSPIPAHVGLRDTLKFLEFMASIICVCIETIKEKLSHISGATIISNRTTSTSWKVKSNFKEEIRSLEQANLKVYTNK